MAVHLTHHRSGFAPGVTEVTRIGEPEDDTGIGFSIVKLKAGQKVAETCAHEEAWLLLDGKVSAKAGAQAADWSRASLFDELPSAVHCPKGTPLELHAKSDCELAVFRARNERPFPVAMYLPAQVRDEHRGKGQLHDTAYRFVRTLFDRTNASPEAELVLGEVVTMPGRWSSYPPHHHPQPEVYHYRFTRPEGYGHAELGDDVFKVRPYDTVKIFDGLDHPQVAAPGYGMFYIWVIRHLPGQPYDKPIFTKEHQWALEPTAQTWWPKGVAP